MTEMPVTPATAEWRLHWPLVAASSAGFSFTAMAVGSFGLFMEPVTQDLRWSRTQMSSGLTVSALMTMLLSPVVGAMVDRWGARRVAIPGLAFTAASFAAFSMASGSIIQWIGLWCVYSALAVATKATVWTTAVSSAFSAGRGLALAVTLSGSAFSMTLAPITARWLVDDYGWREAYFWMGIGWGLAVLSLLVPFFHDHRALQRHKPQVQIGNAPPSKPVHGLSVAQALRSSALWRIAIAEVLTIVVISAVSMHLVPILGERGITREAATFVAASSGVASICGKLMTGWILDSFGNRWIGSISLAIPALSFVLLLGPADANVMVAALAIVILGFANGSSVQVCAYMTSRYAGLRHFGQIYGIIGSLLAAGLGLGPMLAGLIFDGSGSYQWLLIAGVPIALLSGLLLIKLGNYPDWEQIAHARRT